MIVCQTMIYNEEQNFEIKKQNVLDTADSRFTFFKPASLLHNIISYLLRYLLYVL